MSKRQFYSTNKHYLRLPCIITFKSPFKSKTNQIASIPTNNSSIRILIIIALKLNNKLSQITILMLLINSLIKLQINIRLFQIGTWSITNSTQKNFNPHIMGIVNYQLFQILHLLIKLSLNISIFLETLLLFSQKINSNTNSSNSNLLFHRLCITLNSTIIEINYIG